QCRDFVAALRGAAAPPPAVNGHAPAPAPSRAETPTPGAADSSQSVTQPLRALEISAPPTVRKAPSEVVGDGCLFPALVVGVGQAGLSVLQRLREGLVDRFGSPAQLPQLRTVLLDTDPEVMRSATRGKPGVALSAAEVLLAPLNRPSHYLKPR